MATLKVAGFSDIIEDRALALNNGDVITLLSSKRAVRVLMVTSFRSGACRVPIPTGSYCTLIDLETGYITFEEPCSRKTCLNRVLSHIKGSKLLRGTAASVADDIMQLKSADISITIANKEVETTSVIAISVEGGVFNGSN